MATCKHWLCLHHGEPHILAENKPAHMVEGGCCVFLMWKLVAFFLPQPFSLLFRNICLYYIERIQTKTSFRCRCFGVYSQPSANVFLLEDGVFGGEAIEGK